MTGKQRKEPADILPPTPAVDATPPKGLKDPDHWTPPDRADEA